MDAVTVTTARQSADIPQPKPYPIVGNLFDMDPNSPTMSLVPVAAKYGPIFTMTVLGYTMIWVTSQKLVAELCDKSRFLKRVHNSLLELRRLQSLIHATCWKTASRSYSRVLPAANLTRAATVV